jgi:hypothetical protein
MGVVMPALVAGIPLRWAMRCHCNRDGRNKSGHDAVAVTGGCAMIRKLASGKYRLYSRKKNAKTGRRRNLGTFGSRAAAQKHERAVQFFKRG